MDWYPKKEETREEEIKRKQETLEKAGKWTKVVMYVGMAACLIALALVTCQKMGLLG